MYRNFNLKCDLGYLYKEIIKMNIFTTLNSYIQFFLDYNRIVYLILFGIYSNFFLAGKKLKSMQLYCIIDDAIINYRHFNLQYGSHFWFDNLLLIVNS